jgi:hypothetical protein
MKRAVAIVAFVAVLAVLLACCQFRGVRQNRQNTLKGRAAAIGLNGTFANDPRFRQVRAIGYSGSTRLFGAKGDFVVVGTVSTSNDLANVEKIILAAQPPGRLNCRIGVATNAFNPPKSAKFH